MRCIPNTSVLCYARTFAYSVNVGTPMDPFLNADPFSFRPSGGEMLDPRSAIEDQEDERRRRESDAIADRYATELSKRGHRSNFSPEYLASLPKSMAEKLRVTPEEEEEVLYLYASTASIPKTADASGVSLDKVRAIVYNPQSQSAIADYRDAMRVSVLQKMQETQFILLDALQDPRKLADSSLTQISSVFQDISESQLQLMAAQREASGSAHAVVNPTAVFTGDELEYMAFLRRRLSAGEAPGPSAISAHADENQMSGHEFVDPDYVSVDSVDPPEELLDDSDANGEDDE